MRLSGKRCVITGGAQGFGQGMVERFVEEGAAVSVWDINGEGAAAVAAAHGAHAVTCNVAEKAAVEAGVDAAWAAMGGVDVVINNAGWSHVNKDLLEVSEDEYDRIMDVNVKSIFHMTNALVPRWRAAGAGGQMINIGSTAGIRPRPGLTWYNASKGAVNLVSRSLAVELAPDNIRVNCIAPVAGETPLLASFMGADTPEKRAAFKATVPLGRFSTPRDIANAALYLASDDADFITGVVLEVDGGRTI